MKTNQTKQEWETNQQTHLAVTIHVKGLHFQISEDQRRSVKISEDQRKMPEA